MSAANDETSPGTAPIKGIGLRVTNIEGNSFVPRRGMFQTTNASVIDGLFEISKPVDFEYKGDYLGDDGTDVMQPHANPSSGSGSYASKVASVKPRNKINFRYIEDTNQMEDVDVMIPMESVRKVQDRFANVLFGYFLGKRLAFPVVDYYVSNKWEKYGLQKCMMNGKGFFFFKFGTREGMEQVLQDGPWLIRNIPIFLKCWSPNTELKKDELKKIPVWVKMHDVPLAAYTEDGLSLIASKLGEPKMLDNETAKMCEESWGRSGYARAIIELNADKEMKDAISVAIPNVEEGGFLKSTIRVEYEWKPPRCSSCLVFGHSTESCPSKVTELAQGDNKGKEKVDDQGYKDGNKRKKGKRKPIQVKDSKKFEYRPKTREDQHEKYKPSTSRAPPVKLTNSFGALSSNESDGDTDQDEVRVEDVTETSKFMENKAQGSGNNTGASTPADRVINV
ncbi:uncharacterized protein LOC110924676 [Helianthus annuus]|uniref:uncharacterized protein LOC110924676 n=1 Tax=Helianthus annuus TaxID=4232 RepID=UPI000B8FE7D0|nr:uncharacterized protein LOC110924676 [Helianthus annuus]